jgi:hypothetical protein
LIDLLLTDEGFQGSLGGRFLAAWCWPLWAKISSSSQNILEGSSAQGFE